MSSSGRFADSTRPDDLRQVQRKRGVRPGDHYVSVAEPFSDRFKLAAPGHLIASERVLQRGGIGRVADGLRRILIGRRIATELEIHERIGPFKGLAVFASDNISSSAYASEEIMRVVAVAGAGALVLTMPLTIAIVVVLAIVVISYQQTIRAYPNGGGSYIVASDNLGRGPGLIAAAALLTDYVLTVAVSIAAGVAALTSIYPRAVRSTRGDRARLRRPAVDRQPARHPGEREPLRHPDLRLSLRDLRRCSRSGSGRPRAAACLTTHRRQRRSRTRGSDRPSGCSSSSERSRRDPSR